MKKTIQRLIFIVTFFCVFNTLTIRAEEIKTPVVEAQGAILMDALTGRVLWEKNSDKPFAMASTTKIMTAVLALELSNPKDVVTISKVAATTPPVEMGLTVGEKIRLEDLLYALMLQSSNDAAVAIAEHVGGSVEHFCELMTQKAKTIGALNTVFRTPNGLDKDDHHSTAKDMALIAAYALKNEEFVRIINTPSVQAPVSGGEFRSYSIINKNRLLNDYSGAIGIKTGYTGKAGHCFVGAAKKNDMLLISVVLASGWGSKGKEQKWVDTKRILNYGFDNYQYMTVATEGEVLADVTVLHSRKKTVSLALDNSYTLPLRADEFKNITIIPQAVKEADAPVNKGDVLGKALLDLNNTTLKELNLVAVESCERHDFKTSIQKIIDEWIKLSR